MGKPRGQGQLDEGTTGAPAAPGKPTSAPAEPPKAPQEAAPSPEAPPTGQALGKAAEAPAKALVEDSPKEEDPNKPQDELEKMFMDNPGPITDFFLVIYRLMKKFEGFRENFVGGFTASIENSNEKFEEENVKKLQEGLFNENPEISAALSEDELLDEGMAIKTIEEKSVKFVCDYLRISHDLTAAEPAKRLAAKFHDLSSAETASYKYTNNIVGIREKGAVPKGTVLFFKIDQEEDEGFRTGGALVPAVATGETVDGKSLIFAFFNAKTGKVEKINLAADDNGFVDSVSFQGLFIPKFNTDPAYFDQNTEELEVDVDLTAIGDLGRFKEEIKAMQGMNLEGQRYDFVFRDYGKRLGEMLYSLKVIIETIVPPKYDQKYIESVRKQVSVLYSEIKGITAFFIDQTGWSPEDLKELEKLKKLLKFFEENPDIKKILEENDKKEVTDTFEAAKKVFEESTKDDKKALEAADIVLLAYERLKESIKLIPEEDAKKMLKEIKTMLAVLKEKLKKQMAELKKPDELAPDSLKEQYEKDVKKFGDALKKIDEIEK